MKIILLSIILVFSFFRIGSSEIELSTAEAFIYTDSESYESLYLLIDEITRGEGSVYHVFPDKTIFGELSSNNLDNTRIKQHIQYFSASNVDLDKIKSYDDDYAYVAALIWNYNHVNSTERFQRESQKEFNSIPIKQDLLINKNTICNSLNTEMTVKASPYGAGFCDTSEYMIGNITVTIIFPESDGTGEENTENWELYFEQYNFLTRVEDAMNWWVEREPKAKLRFIYEWMTEPVSIEPINHNYCHEEVWSSEIMTNLGFNNYENYIDKVREFNNYQIDKYKTDWAFVIFAVDGSNDSDGNFKQDIDPDCPGSEFKWFAYSWLGGPFTVIVYKRDFDSTSKKPYNAIVAHETAHIFYALDEYYGSGSYCTERSGYLNVENQNYEGNCLTNDQCLMRTYANIAFYQKQLCKYTREQIGWRDNDDDGILEILDFDQKSKITSISSSSAPELRGFADCTNTLENMNKYDSGGNITVNKISNVEIRIDAGGWQTCEPEDGLFDSALEYFNIKLPPALTVGNHFIEIKTCTKFGIDRVQLFEDQFQTENLYFPIINSEYINTILIATNFSTYSTESIIKFYETVNDTNENTVNLTFSPNETKYIDLHKDMNITKTGYALITKTYESDIKFYSYCINYTNRQTNETKIQKPLSAEAFIPLWIVSPKIKTTSYLYIYNVDTQTSKFNIIISDKYTLTEKELSYDLTPGEKIVIDIQNYFDHDSRGFLRISSIKSKFITNCIIYKNGFGMVDQIQGFEKSFN